MASKSRSKHQGSLYAQYKTEQRWSKNRRKKLERLAKVHPENAQIQEALKNIKYRRKTPSTSAWSKTDRYFAHLFKQFEGKCNPKDLSKERVVMTGNSRPSPERKASQDPKGFFSIAARAKNSLGEYCWA